MNSKTKTVFTLEDLQTVKAAAKTTVKELRDEKDNLQKRAREHALATALEFYECDTEYLRKLVFANWLEEHAFEENFRPLKWIAM